MVELWTQVLRNCRSGAQRVVLNGTEQTMAMEELERSSRVSAATYASLLKQCIARKALGHGRQIHAHILAAKEKDPRAAPTAPFLGNLLLQLYARCGDLDRARSIFDGLAHRNLFSWTTMMGGYVQRGRFDRALDLYHCLEKREEPSYRSIEPDAFVYTIALAACSSLGDLASGRAIHARCHDRSIRDVILDTAIINMYAKCGCVGEAKIVFDSMRQRDSIAWNAMIAAFAQNGHLREAILLYLEMTAQGLDPSEATFVSVLGACSSLSLVRSIHLRFLESGIQSSDATTSLIAAFGRCQSLDEARLVFDRAPRCSITIFAWTAIIAAYTHHGRCKEALELFQSLLLSIDSHGREDLEPDGYTYSIVLMACANTGAIDQGRAIHARILARKKRSGSSMMESSVLGSLISMYSKCGSLDEAREAFDRAEEQSRSAVVWNAMIAGYVQHERAQDAIELYRAMASQTSPPIETTAFTLSILLGACASLESLDRGREIHATIIDRGMESDTVLLNSLVRMYSKCGSLLDAMRVFQSALQDRDRGGGGSIDAITWNAIIVASARSSAGNLSIHLFHEMLLHGFDPNGITLTAVLTACGHAGMIESFHSYFALVVGDCRVVPGIEHYECMADLLGRSGRIGDVQELLQAMPFFPNAASWRSLLGACRVHSSGVEIAGVAAGEVAVIEPSDHTAYVMLSNVYTINNS
ncbi:pentatricopeptide repeat-containing protein At2g13600 [Selaginella moellendorffii]|uniref:pentatricopeptide repeat-containing protein At2g13600 n=1 Tax=Selaginella moellendorffii TaxID=88036 RepID=UPI000D1C9095|nr:pentatricopeptide repeat-containing protein At2g13600 [Selaginella moellendorffii]|eukprot:XP_024519906.1 pentatricopeptide repeat-containing protein At2g13600 [Selaginella moellendorffii]